MSEPFFEWSVAALRDGVPSAPEFETSIEELAKDPNEQAPPVLPVGVIVHVTRCGSTLVLNALRAAEDVVGLGEPQPIMKALHLASAKSESRSRLGRSVAASLLKTFAGYKGDSGKKLVIKCGSEGTLYLKQIRRLWPNVPVLILIREPAEVVASNVQHPPGYLPAWFEQDCPFGNPPPSTRSDRLDFCAWMIGQSFVKALEGFDRGCMVVDYANLSPEVVRGVAARFGLHFSVEGEQEFYSAFDVSAKMPQAPFSGDSPRKRKVAQSDSVRESVRRWAMDSYLRLKEHAVSGVPGITGICLDPNTHRGDISRYA